MNEVVDMIGELSVDLSFAADFSVAPWPRGPRDPHSRRAPCDVARRVSQTAAKSRTSARPRENARRAAIRRASTTGRWSAETHGSQASTSDGSIAAAGISRRQLVSGNVEASCRGHRTLGLTTPTVVPLSFSWKSRHLGLHAALSGRSTCAAATAIERHKVQAARHGIGVKSTPSPKLLALPQF